MKKETGLMFKAPLVRAILEGRKTQTRRILKPQPAPNHPHDGGTKWVLQLGLHVPVGSVGHLSVREKMGLCCPMGKPGDRIYVRETWAYGIHAMGALRDEDGPFVFAADGTTEGRLSDQWLPSIHMPKHAARIWLEITGVRVERLQSITRADIKAEGVEITEPRAFSLHGLNAEQRENMRRTFAAYQFQELWDSTTGRPKLPENKNSKRYARVKHWLDTHPDTTGWAANPWVWVIDFKTISTTGRPA